MKADCKGTDRLIERLRIVYEDKYCEQGLFNEAADALEAKDQEIERLETKYKELEEIYNECYQELIDTDLGSQKFEARVEQLEELAYELSDWFGAYPEDIFTPLRGDPIKKTGDYDTKEKRNLITRASASMARHMIERIPEKIKQALGEKDGISS